MILHLFHLLQWPDSLHLFNAVFSGVLVLMIIYVLVSYGSVFNIVERLGHGCAGSAMFLSIFKQLGFADAMAPFDLWYTSLWRMGWFLLLSGKIFRMWKHQRANTLQRRYAKGWRAGRG